MIFDYEALKSLTPNFVKIGGVDYDVNLVKEYAFINDDRAEINDGEFNINRAEIRLATVLKDGKTLVSLDRTKTIFLHEILHGIFYHYLADYTENEEQIVTQLAKGLYQVITENPDLIKMLLTT